MNEIDFLLNDFVDSRSLKRRINPFDEDKYIAKLNYYASHGNEVVYTKQYENSPIEVKRDSDMVFAILYEKESPTSLFIICEIFVGGKKVHTVDLINNQIEWLLNGAPLLLISLRFHDVVLKFYDKHTFEPLNNLKITLYNSILSNEARRSCALNGHFSKLEQDKYFVTMSGMGSIFDSAQLNELFKKQTLNYRIFRHEARGSFRIKYPDSVLIYDNLIEDTDISSLLIPFGYSEKPQLHKCHEYFFIIIDKIIKKLKYYQRVGDMLTIGTYALGESIGEHRDGSLQGGDFSLIIYSEDAIEGGEIVFRDQVIKPLKYRCIIFDVNALHYTKPLLSGKKSILGCELILKLS